MVAISLPPGDTEGVQGLCLEPHDLAIAKYAASREKDLIFTRELASRGIVSEERLLGLLDHTAVMKKYASGCAARSAETFKR